MDTALKPSLAREGFRATTLMEYGYIFKLS